MTDETNKLKSKKNTNPATEISLIYIVFGSLWIFFSDKFVFEAHISESLRHDLPTLKGLFFIFLTGFLLFLLIKRYMKRISKVERELRISEERMVYALEGSNSGVWDFNLEFSKFYFSPVYYSISGYNFEDVLESPAHWIEIMHPDDAPKAIELFEKYIKQPQGMYSSEHRIRCKNGDYKWIIAKGKIVEYNADNKPIRMAGTISEISRLKETEQKLQKSLNVLSILSDCNKIINTSLHETQMFEEICRLLVIKGAYTAAWVGFKNYDDIKSISAIASYGQINTNANSFIVHYGDDKYSNGPTGKAIKLGKPIIVNNFNEDANLDPWRDVSQKYRIFSGISLPIKDGQNVMGAITLYSSNQGEFAQSELLLFSQLADDLSQGLSLLRFRELHAETLAKITENEELFRTAFYESLIPSCLTDLKGNIDSANLSFTDLVGYKEIEIAGQPFAANLMQEDKDMINSFLMAVAGSKEKKTSSKVKIRQFKGREIWVEISALVIESINRRPYLLVLLIDVSKRVETEQALANTKAKLVKLTEMIQLLRDKNVNTISVDILDDMELALRR